MSTGARIVVLALLVLVGALSAVAQTDTGSLGRPDSVSVSVVSKQKTSPSSTTRVAAHEEHSATKALLWSLLPGAGQVYNRQAWKIPIIYGAFAGVGYFVYYEATNMKKFKTEYLYRVNHDGATQLAAYSNYPTSNIYNMYQYYNKYFQLSIIIGVAVYGLNLIDAYVFGHLFSYDISDDISLSASPSLVPVAAGDAIFAPAMSFRLTF